MITIDDIKILSIIICLNLNSILIGYILGRLTFSQKQSSLQDKPKSFFNNEKQTTVTEQVLIDDKKVVLEIKTDNLEKKYNSLGDIKTSNENISESVNKLKNLKK